MATDTSTKVTLRAITKDDIDEATNLSREQAWPHREEDWRLFIELGEGLVAVKDNKVVGTIMGWKFGESATLGMVIVANSMQKQGIGHMLMNAMLEILKGYNIVLNATSAGFPLYQKKGFREIGIVNQHQIKVPIVPLAQLRPGERVRPIGEDDEVVLSEIYNRASGMDKSRLLSKLTSVSETVVLTRVHVPIGFAQFRRFGRGWTIGPVIAPDKQGAQALILHWLSHNIGKFCRLDIIGESGLSPWLEGLGIPCVDSVKTMVYGTDPRETDKTKSEKIMAIAAQALG